MSKLAEVLRARIAPAKPANPANPQAGPAGISRISDISRGVLSHTRFEVLSNYREALTLGRLHVCCNCAHFRFPIQDMAPGDCGRFNLEAWPFVPLWCSGFAPSNAPVVPEFLPDSDDVRAETREYAK